MRSVRIHARRPVFAFYANRCGSRARPLHLPLLRSQAVGGTVPWERTAPALPWGVAWLCVGEPYFIERHPMAYTCGSGSSCNFGRRLGRPVGQIPRTKVARPEGASVFNLSGYCLQLRRSRNVQGCQMSPRCHITGRCRTLRWCQSDRCLICILIMSEVGTLFIYFQSQEQFPSL